MKLEIRSIHGHGKATEEYVIIDVLSDCDAKYYMVADTTYQSGGISNKVRHTHWFYPAALKKGDVLVLHTGTGTDRSDQQTNGATYHQRFWGLKSAVWNDDGDGALLFEINSWRTTKVAETK